jgi:hypothetical protein
MNILGMGQKGVVVSLGQKPGQVGLEQVKWAGSRLRGLRVQSDKVQSHGLERLRNVAPCCSLECGLVDP